MSNYFPGDIAGDLFLKQLKIMVFNHFNCAKIFISCPTGFKICYFRG